MFSVISSMIHQEEGHHSLRIGSLILHSIGQLLPHQIQTNHFNTEDYIFPVSHLIASVIHNLHVDIQEMSIVLFKSLLFYKVAWEKIKREFPHRLGWYWRMWDISLCQVGFRTSRFYWSHRVLYHRCRYICSISEMEGWPEFSIRVIEDGFEDVVYKDKSPKGRRTCWFLDKLLVLLVKFLHNFIFFGWPV